MLDGPACWILLCASPSLSLPPSLSVFLSLVFVSLPFPDIFPSCRPVVAVVVIIVVVSSLRRRRCADSLVLLFSFLPLSAARSPSFSLWLSAPLARTATRQYLGPGSPALLAALGRAAFVVGQPEGKLIPRCSDGNATWCTGYVVDNEASRRCDGEKEEKDEKAEEKEEGSAR